MGRDWSREEVSEAVAEYFAMLRHETAGRPYVKAEHRRALLGRLDGRSEQAIEFKHRNISGVLLDLGCPFIDGYKPALNYQRRLRAEVERYLEAHPDLTRGFRDQAESEMKDLPQVDDILDLLEEPPSPLEQPERVEEGRRPRTPEFVDFMALEARNRKLGSLGEVFALRYERARLIEADRGNLADRVEHVARTRGDGLGFDIHSYEPNGTDRFVEVKTTSWGKRTPFYLTTNELDFSRKSRDRFHLHRIFRFRTSPRLFILHGDLGRCCMLKPTEYRAVHHGA